MTVRWYFVYDLRIICENPRNLHYLIALEDVFISGKDL